MIFAAAGVNNSASNAQRVMREAQMKIRERVGHLMLAAAAAAAESSGLSGVPEACAVAPPDYAARHRRRSQMSALVDASRARQAEAEVEDRANVEQLVQCDRLIEGAIAVFAVHEAERPLRILGIAASKTLFTSLATVLLSATIAALRQVAPLGLAALAPKFNEATQ